MTQTSDTNPDNQDQTQPQDQPQNQDHGQGQSQGDTLAALEAQRAKLIKRRSSLVRRVTHGKKTVEYDLSAADAAIAQVEKDIAAEKEKAFSATGGRRKLRQLRVTSGKGY